MGDGDADHTDLRARHGTHIADELRVSRDADRTELRLSRDADHGDLRPRTRSRDLKRFTGRGLRGSRTIHGTRITRISNDSRDADHADLKRFNGTRITRISNDSRDADYADLKRFTGRGSRGSQTIQRDADHADLKRFNGTRITRISNGSRDADHADRKLIGRISGRFTGRLITGISHPLMIAA